MESSKAHESREKTVGGIKGLAAVALIVAFVCSTFTFLVLSQREALAQPTKSTNCTASGCHVTASTTATFAWGTIYNATKNPASPTALTVSAGSSFEVEWIATNMTDSAHGNTGMSFMIGLPTVTPTAWTISNGTTNNSGITGWNTIWDATAGHTWRTGTLLSVSNWASSPNAYSIDWTNSNWDVASTAAAYDNGSTTTPGDLDRTADKMGVDAVINVPADTPAGTYTITLAGIGHYYTTKTNKCNKTQTLSITVTAAGGGDTTKPVVSAGFSATTPSLSKTISVSGFAATDNTGVTGYMITTSATAPLSTDAGWLASAPTSYTVAADGSYTLYPWAKDAAGNVSAVYGTPVAVVVDSTKPVVSAGFAATTPSLSRTITVSGFAATDASGVTGYMITTSATAPLAGDAGWLATAPTSYAVGADGTFTLYPWAKDTYGNVSAVYASPVTVVVDTVKPTVSSTVPVNGATGTALNGTVTINFSEAVSCATVTTSSVTIAPAVTWALTSCSGSQAVFTPSGQADSTAYTVTVGAAVADSAGNTLAASYPFSYTTSAPAPNNAPGTPASLTQYKSDGTTLLTRGLYTNLTTLIFKGAVTDPDSDTVKLDIELADVGAAFTGTPTCSSTLVTSGTTAAATCSGIANGRFKWQARATDSKGLSGSWTQY